MIFRILVRIHHYVTNKPFRNVIEESGKGQLGHLCAYAPPSAAVEYIVVDTRIAYHCEYNTIKTLHK